MAISQNILLIPLDGTGTEIPTLNVTDPYSAYLITGAQTATGSYSIVPTGVPQQGTTFIFKYKATLDITTRSKTFSIFGQSLTQNQLLIETDIECYYDGSAWIVFVKPSLTTQFVESVNIVASAITSSQLANLSVTTPKINTNAVTNAKLAQMSTMTVKANVTGGTADPQDVSVSALSSLITGNWSTTGNSGLTAGTNFIGTTDDVDLLFKVNSIESGRVDLTYTNTSFGFQALKNRTNGEANVAIGNSALQTLTTGTGNSSVGQQSLFNITTGSGNTAIGISAGYLLTTGTNNTFVGYNTNTNTNSSISRIALGYGAIATSNYQFAIPDDVTTIKFRGVVYSLPTSNASGVLTNDGSGNLTWA